MSAFVLMACSAYPNLIGGISYVLYKSIHKLRSVYRKINIFCVDGDREGLEGLEENDSKEKK